MISQNYVLLLLLLLYRGNKILHSNKLQYINIRFERERKKKKHVELLLYLYNSVTENSRDTQINNLISFVIDCNEPMCMYVRRGCFYCDAKNLMSVIKRILKENQPTFISKQKQTINTIIRNKIMSHILNRIFN